MLGVRAFNREELERGFPSQSPRARGPRGNSSGINLSAFGGPRRRARGPKDGRGAGGHTVEVGSLPSSPSKETRLLLLQALCLSRAPERPGLTFRLRVSLILQVKPKGLSMVRVIQLRLQVKAHIRKHAMRLQLPHQSWMMCPAWKSILFWPCHGPEGIEGR